ncbi:hypothetical protein PBCVNEJV1_313L [Paramecium bursaria Chlorella virus NE-JV-1]|nr:hypothetical protein PBCVNEJV1_313L [Paramecium bursaria Chlorella virus NE-JV-1]
MDTHEAFVFETPSNTPRSISETNIPGAPKKLALMNRLVHISTTDDVGDAESSSGKPANAEISTTEDDLEDSASSPCKPACAEISTTGDNLGDTATSRIDKNACCRIS